MKNIIYITGIVAMFILLSGRTIFAQGDAVKMKNMKNKSEMSDMMKSPHHKLMMAHRQNVLTFAKTLRDLADDSENFDADFAKTMVNEIKRSSEMMDKVHKDHMSKMKAENKMNAEKRKKMASMMEKMKKEKTELTQHIKALEKSVGSASIDSKEVEKHSAAIVAKLEKMKMAESHKRKMKMDKKNM